MSKLIGFESVVFAIVLICFSCDEKLYTGDVDCNECYIDRPSKADLIINVTVDYKFPAVPIVIYEGNIEEGKIVFSDTAYSSPFQVTVKVNQRYAVRAEYNANGSTYYGVDGTKIKVLTVSDACDETCYVVEDERMDVRLKKEFLNY
jgi:hypothetical protein